MKNIKSRDIFRIFIVFDIFHHYSQSYTTYMRGRAVVGLKFSKESASLFAFSVCLHLLLGRVNKNFSSLSTICHDPMVMVNVSANNFVIPAYLLQNLSLS